MSGAGKMGIVTTSPTENARLEVAGRIWQTGLGGSTFFGQGAGKNDDLIDNLNVFVGFEAGYLNTSGYNNTALGYQSFRSNTTGGYQNLAIGHQALYYNTTGYRNSAVGYRALYNN